MALFLLFYVLTSYWNKLMLLHSYAINVTKFVTEKKSVLHFFKMVSCDHEENIFYLPKQNIFLSYFQALGTINIPSNLLQLLYTNWHSSFSNFLPTPFDITHLWDISYTWESVTIHRTKDLVHTFTVRCCIMLHNILLRKLIVSHKSNLKAN